jgi:hypothetical protein
MKIRLYCALEALGVGIASARSALDYASATGCSVNGGNAQIAVITASVANVSNRPLGCTRNRLFVQPDQLLALP